MKTPTRKHSSINVSLSNRRTGVWLLSFSLFWTYQSNSFAADSHTQGDAFWAEAAKLYPAFEPPADVGSHPTADNDEFGKWGTILDWPHIPVSAANLPDGRVLTWASNKTNHFPNGQPEFTYAATWDPETGNFVEINHNSHDLFCAATVMLEDGSVFVSGGRNAEDSVWTSVFDYRTSNWTLLENMKHGRFYNTSVAMPDGRVFTALGGGGGPNPEVWTSGSGWKLLPAIDLSGAILDFTGHGEQLWWPLLSLAPNGEIFHAGPTPKMHYMNPDGNGTLTEVALTEVGPQITEWYPKNGVAIMYDVGKLLVAGGWTSGIKSNVSSTAEAMVIDINGPTPVKTIISPMQFDRKFHNGIVLPNGEVLMVGGNTSGLKFSDKGTVLAAEIWNPDTGAWREVANASVPRNYHSIALLLPDGTVLSGGGGLCGSCPANHQNAQVYSPPYLFNPNGSLATRPVISSGPATIRSGELFQVAANPNMQQFGLIKMSSTTHAVNTDVRYINVPFTETSSGQYDLTAHNNSNVLSPGFWMLFALNTQGVPSVALILQVITDDGGGGGQILREWWTGIPGKTIPALTGDPDYPNNPNGSDLLKQFEAPSNWGDNYGNRLRGYIHPPTTGDYTFWIASDDASELRLSSDDLPANASLIASAPSWTNPKQWTKFAQQESISITLQAGQKYYVEALHKDGTSLDHLAVAWQGPGLGQQVIDGSFLSPFSADGEGSLPPILTSPGNQVTQEGSAVNLALVGTDPDAGPNPLSFIASGLPPGLTLDSVTGIISGTVPVGSSDDYTVTVTLTDGADLDKQVFTWSVTADGGGPPGGGTGQILREWWLDIRGNTIAELTDNPNYPDNPSGSDLLTTFEAPENIGTWYGTRIRGYLHPTTTEDYTFWLAGDDHSELWLSTDDLPANKVRIANVPDFTLSRQWTKYPEQKSATIHLQAGEKYYVEVIHKERSGPDNVAVSWQSPSLAQQVIDGSFLSPFSADGEGSQPPILTSPGNQVTQEGSAVNLALVGTDPDAGPDPLSFSASGLPPGLTLDSVTGIISGTVPVGSSDDYTVTVTLTDGADLDDQVFTWSVTADGGGPPGGGTGQILREWWQDIRGNTIAELTDDPNYPDNPSGSDLLTTFEAPENIGTWYGTRIRGYLHPTTTEDYTFWLAGDDHSELWLSTDDLPANKVRIANVPDFTLSRQWTKYPEQKSATIHLQAGEKYYVEVIHKERSGPDNVAVAWQAPGLAREVIDGSFLSPFSGAPFVAPRESQTQAMGKIVYLGITPVDLERSLRQGLGEDAIESPITVEFSGSIEPKDDGYRILCSLDLLTWEDCTDEFTLTQRIVHSENVSPTVTLQWISETEQLRQKFFRIELTP